MRRVSTRVLPDPAPARMHSGPRRAVTAPRWASSSPASSTAGSIHRSVRTVPTATFRCVDVAPERFEELVADALDDIPDELGRLMDNVAVMVVEDAPEPGLLGLLRGRPADRAGRRLRRLWLHARPHHDLPAADPAPMCRTEAEVVEQVRITVVHEVAHHFGIDDDRLDELGWG